MKVVYNSCFGGFGLSDLAIGMLKDIKGLDPSENISHWDIKRDDPDLVKVVEELGESANGSFSKLRIAEIPDGARFEIDEYDGLEEVVPPRMTW